MEYSMTKLVLTKKGSKHDGEKIRVFQGGRASQEKGGTEPCPCKGLHIKNTGLSGIDASMACGYTEAT
jgi:hypothetical protein